MLRLRVDTLMKAERSTAETRSAEFAVNAGRSGGSPAPLSPSGEPSGLIAELQPRLRQAMAARYGPEIGHEAAHEAIAWALANPHRLVGVEFPLAYLYRVAQSKARPSLRWFARRSGALADDRIVAEHVAPIDPTLVAALAALPPDHRTAVLLVHAYGWSVGEVAAARNVPVTTVTNHLRRGLVKLRSILQEDNQ